MNLAEFEVARDEKDAFFVYLHAQYQETDSVERASRRFLATATFFVSTDPQLVSRLGVRSLPALVAVQNAELGIYQGDLNSHEALVKWISEHQAPFFAELDSANSAEVLSTEDLVVVLIAEASKSSFQLRARPEVTKAAVQFYKERQQGLQKEKVRFVWLNAEKWASFAARLYDLAPEMLPAVVVTRPGDNVYFDRQPGGERVRVDSKEILTFVRSVAEGKIEGKSVGGVFRGLMTRVQKVAAPVAEFITKNLWLVAGSVVVMVGVVVWFLSQVGEEEKFGKGD